MNIRKIFDRIFKISMIGLVGILGVTFSLSCNKFFEQNEVKNKVDNIVELKEEVKDESTGINKSKILLVNKDNKLDKKYTPDNMTEPNIRFSGTNKLVSADIVSYLENMFSDALADGINLVGVSGYRSYEYQQKLFEEATNGNTSYQIDYVALPGHSEHQTGLAIDILTDSYMYLDEGFKYTNEYKWLVDNAYKYGFILRYPEGKEDVTGYPYEPWHFRFVGTKAAYEIYKKNICLEEYLKTNK